MSKCEFNIERYMHQFEVLFTAKYGIWPDTKDIAASGLSESQIQSLACVAGYTCYEQLHKKRSCSITIEIADNGDIKIS